LSVAASFLGLLTAGCPVQLRDTGPAADDDDATTDDDDDVSDDDDTPIDENAMALVSDASWTATGNMLPPGWFWNGIDGVYETTVPSPDGCGAVLDADRLGRDLREHEFSGTESMWAWNAGGTTYFRRLVPIPPSATDLQGAITIVANDDLVVSVDGVTRAKDFATQGDVVVELQASEIFVPGAENTLNLRVEDLYEGCGFAIVSGVVSWGGDEAGSLEIRSDDAGFTIVEHVATPPWWTQGFAGSTPEIGGWQSCSWTWNDSIGRPLAEWEHRDVMPMNSLLEHTEAYYVKDLQVPDFAWNIRLRLSVVADDDAQLAVNGQPLLADFDGGVAGADMVEFTDVLLPGWNTIALRTQDTAGGCHWVALNGTVDWEM
jgi:hypothetical protein